jgi:hypothetical protein
LLATIAFYNPSLATTGPKSRARTLREKPPAIILTNNLPVAGALASEKGMAVDEPHRQTTSALVSADFRADLA